MSLRFVAFAVLAAGCGSSAEWCEPGPWRTEVWSEAPRIEAKLRDGCGFPDTPTDYQISAHGHRVLADSVEHFGRRHSRSSQNGGIEVAIWDRACLVTAASVECRDIDYRRW